MRQLTRAINNHYNNVIVLPRNIAYACVRLRMALLDWKHYRTQETKQHVKQAIRLLRSEIG